MAQSPRFGTDGIRGSAETEVTPLLARALGQAAGEVLGVATAVIGGDTRESTPQLDLALSAGLVASGVEVMRLGVAPTPMVAFIAAQRSAIGFVISASHNPYYDNGIKIFGPAGTKLTKQAESEISERLGQLLSIPSAGSLAGVTAGVTADVLAGVTADVRPVLRPVLRPIRSPALWIPMLWGSTSHIFSPCWMDAISTVCILLSTVPTGPHRHSLRNVFAISGHGWIS
jgi:hypothetical protein